MNYRNTINKGISILRKHLIHTAGIDAELLLSNLIGKSREKILLNLEDELNYKEIDKDFNLINRRKKKEPISYIIGKKFFWKNEFIVNKDVLTPRFETELLIEEILKFYKYKDRINVLDLGIGSGCILVSLLKEKRKWKGIGVDLSDLALKTAQNNAKIQQVNNRIKYIKSDIDKISPNKYDLIVSNPPYINKIGYNNLDFGVKGFEPRLALYGGIDGLDIIEKVISRSKYILKNSGILAMEFGLGQHYKVSDLLRKNGFYLLKIIKDYQSIKRFILAIKK